MGPPPRRLAGVAGDWDSADDAYRDGEPQFIVERMSQAAIRAAANGRHLVAELRDIREQWSQRITARRDSAIHRVADFLLKRPVFNAALLHRELGITTGNARRYIDPLVLGHIVVEFTDRSHNRAWRAPEVLSALDAFGERAGRRGSRCRRMRTAGQNAHDPTGTGSGTGCGRCGRSSGHPSTAVPGSGSRWTRTSEPTTG